MCYREESASTNMHLERWWGVLKYVHLDGSTINRCDRLTWTLACTMQDLFFKHAKAQVLIVVCCIAMWPSQ